MDLPIPNQSAFPLKFVEANGLKHAYLEVGQGPAIFFLHGFPDSAYGWEKSLSYFSESHRCIAPFLRGYYPSGIPANGDYAMKTVAQDIVAIADQMGIDRIIVAGQDWGAMVGYSIANLVPDRLEKLITVAIPHPAYIRLNAMDIFRARHFIRFRNAKASLGYTRRRDLAYINRLYDRWSPNWSERHQSAEQIKETYRLEGRLEAALGYYWVATAARQDKALQKWYAQRPTMPILCFAGKADGALTVRHFLEMEKRIKTPFQLAIHDTAGHFLHQEAPDFFNQRMQEFL